MFLNVNPINPVVLAALELPLKALDGAEILMEKVGVPKKAVDATLAPLSLAFCAVAFGLAALDGENFFPPPRRVRR